MNEDLVSGIDERLWTEKEVAHLLHVSTHTMWVWRRQKKVTFIKLPNGLIRYRKRDLEGLLSEGLRRWDENRCEHLRRVGGNSDDNN